MKQSKSRFNSSRFTTPTPFPVKCEHHNCHSLSLLLTRRIANFDPLTIVLLCAEISFLVTLTALIGVHVAVFYTPRRGPPSSVGLRVEVLSRRSQGCTLGSPLRADHSPTISRLSFTALDWPFATSLPIPPPLSSEAVYLGPGALLDDDSTTSCFAFSGSSGGAVLVSASEKYAITQFTLDNTAVDTVVDSIYYPKEGALWGLFEGPLPEGLKNVTTSFVTQDAAYVIIGAFCFSSEHGPVQSFSTDDSIVSLPTIKFSVFYLEVLSNWGGSHTCLGRIRLHGNP